ncbi:MAG: DUF2917 domain-containing protein [Anaerolineales bacterium]
MTVNLTQNAQRSLVIRRGAEIRCLEGVLWITQEGDLRDYILKPGETFVTDRKGKVVLQALKHASTFSLN